MADLSSSFAGLSLKNPVIIGSSGLTNNENNILSLEKNGAAAVVLKSLFEEEIVREMNIGLGKMSGDGFLYPETLEFYEDSYGEEESTVKYLELIKKVKASCSIPVIASINCLSANQWTTFPELIEEAGADALELNIFLLPADLNKEATEQEETYYTIVNEVLKQVKIPVVAKISPYFSNLATVINKLSNTGLKGLVLFNRYYEPDFDINTFEHVPASVLSQPGDLYQSLRWIALMAGRVNCDLAATTGIHSADALIKQLLAGAKAVEIASSLYTHGHGFIQNLLQGLEKWMDAKSFAAIDDFRGKMSAKESDNPAVYERVQFMKYFRGYTV